jgi:ElaB/YqjD/DUF883 family membrane-anchored ribosome-binding protein
MEQAQTQTDRTLNKMRDIPSRAEDMADEARTRLDDTMAAISEKARYAARYADRRVQANPWTAVGIGFAAGMVFGAMLAMAVNSVANSQRGMLGRFG